MTAFHEEPFHNRESPCACDSSLAGRLKQQVSMSQGISPLEVYGGEEVCKNQRQKKCNVEEHRKEVGLGG